MKILIDTADLEPLLNAYQRQNPNTYLEEPWLGRILNAFLLAPDPDPPIWLLSNRLTRALVTFDLETTGTDVAKDRIISIALHKLWPGSEAPSTFSWLLHPGVAIPAASTAVHGIRDEDVAGNATFSDVALEIASWFTDADVCTFNGNHFDVQLLSEEFARHGVRWPAPGTRSIDTRTIFHKKEGRSLADAHEFYLGAPMVGNHEADADTLATFNVLRAMLSRYDDLAAMSLDELHLFCQYDPNAVDLAGKITRDEDGDYAYGFGKHKGEKIKDQPGYAIWMLGSNFPANTLDWINKILDKCCR